jgi:pyruvate/2-oxoglutarate dehydrogenase complex dihydrolipoamide dehydrogenase (E3) component
VRHRRVSPGLALTFEDIRTLRSLPDRVCVIGAADTGCQLTSILADFGCQVALLAHSSRIVPRADEDISAELEHAFRARASTSSRAQGSNG